MKEIEFNLLTEPWVRVRRPDNTVQEVSLTDALLHAQDYVDLAGEMPTQDAAMLRLLLAVLFTVFSRVNVEGEPEPFEEEDDALARWGDLWQLEHFPEQPLRDYLEQWKDRFWLFHPTHPFWQVPGAAIGTEYNAAKLNGEMSESSNKLRLFPLYAVIDAYKNLNIGDHFFRPFFELLVGTDYVRKMIIEGKSAEEIKNRWKGDVEKFKEQRKPYLLYQE